MKSFTTFSIYFFFCFSFLSLPAQDWQWAIRGGSTNNISASAPFYNNIRAIDFDQQGNIFVLGLVGASNTQVAGHSLPGYSAIGQGAHPDILLASFDALGQFRWGKTFGGSTLEMGGSLALDSNGNVYVVGRARIGETNFAGDTNTAGSGLDQLNFLIKYNNQGQYQWLRTTEADTQSGHPYSIGYRALWAGHSLYWLHHLRPGALPGTPHTVTTEGIYILRYNAAGQLADRIMVDMDADSPFSLNGIDMDRLHFARHPGNGDFYVGGYHDGRAPLLIGGDTIHGSMYLAAFDSTGQLKWKKQSDPNSPFTTVIRDMKLDSDGSLFIAGSSKNNAMLYDGVIFSSPKTHTAPLLLKLNNQGGVLWYKFGVANAASWGTSLSINQDEVAITGVHGGLYWQGPRDRDTLTAVTNQGYDAFIARFDRQSGDLRGMVSAQTNFGGASYGHAIAADRHGDYYLGGNFSVQLYLGADTLLKIGSQRSFFLAKYGCSEAAPRFVHRQDSSGRFHFQYSGPPADSLHWDLGEGGPLYRGDSLHYAYGATGSFVVCLTAYNALCGDSTWCDTVVVNHIGLPEQRRVAVQLFPNPARDYFSLRYQSAGGLEDLSLALYDLRGRRLWQETLPSGSDSRRFTTATLPPGLYQVILRRRGVLLLREKLLIERQ